MKNPRIDLQQLTSDKGGEKSLKTVRGSVINEKISHADEIGRINII